MTNAQWLRVRDVFGQAIERDRDGLSAWLVEQVGDDSQVLAEAQSLLTHHHAIGGFLAEPIGERLPEVLGFEAPFTPGQTFGPYLIERQIGQGGMGCVYRAVDQRLGRVVALKVVSPEWVGDDTQRERLRREARVAAALNHPGICTVYALEELDGTVAIVTEFLEGHTLRDEIAGSRRPTMAEAMETARALAAALASAHAAGLAHRDLKPENVMRTQDGRLKILDFGLARATSPDAGPLGARVTAPAAVIGTPAYMAPEQINGEPADQRSDVFALGVLLYEYIIGKHPFDASTPLGVIGRVLDSEPERLDVRLPSIPRVLATVVDRCLRKPPDSRYASAGEVLRALDDGVVVAPASTTQAWWRGHQMAVIAMYFAASALAWQVKEWRDGVALFLFVGISVLATVGGMLRGHLVFTAFVHGVHLDAERVRIEPITLAADLLIAVSVAIAGGLVISTSPLLSVLTLGLAVGLAVTRLVVEPATARAAFGHP